MNTQQSPSRPCIACGQPAAPGCKTCKRRACIKATQQQMRAWIGQFNDAKFIQARRGYRAALPPYMTQ